MSQELPIEHFDPIAKYPLDIEEKIPNPMVRYLFPDSRIAVATFDPKIHSVEHLESGYRNMTLQFASGKRMYFSDRPVGEVLFPTPSDRAAYGSLPFTGCKEFRELKRVRTLIIDHKTGENGGIFDPERAKRAVADCWGRMSLDLADRLTERSDTPVQFRLGMAPQAGNDSFRIAKGTLMPDKRLRHLGRSIQVAQVERDDRYLDLSLNFGEYDLILPTSAFKGRKDVPLGSHVLDLGIGVKTIAEYGSHAIGTQVLVNYPKGVREDILPAIEELAAGMAEKSSDPASLARAYVELYERRAQNDEIPEWMSSFSAMFDLEETKRYEEKIYRVLKSDLENYGQLLEHPYIIDFLKDSVRSQWHNLAFGKAICFSAGMAQPHPDLGELEVCIPKLPENERLILTRSPLVNSNGVIVVTNRHLPEVMHVRGSVFVNPDSAARHLQADFDGDRLVFEKASLYPTLTEEIERSLAEDRRYPDVVKLPKAPYTGSFSEIAVACCDNAANIGTLSNAISRAVSLEKHVEAVAELPASKQQQEIASIRAHFQSRYASSIEKNRPLGVPEPYRPLVQKIVNSSSQPREILDATAQIQRQVVIDLSNTFQVALDAPKSARRPNMEEAKKLGKFASFAKVAWIPQKKDEEKKIYGEFAPVVTTLSPIDEMIRAVNSHFVVHQLTPRPSIGYRDFFGTDEPPHATQIAQSLKEQCREILQERAELRSQLKSHPRCALPYLTANAKGETETHLIFPNFSALPKHLYHSEAREMKIEFVPIANVEATDYFRTAVILNNDEGTIRIGLSPSRKEASDTYQVKMMPPISPARLSSLGKQFRKELNNLRERVRAGEFSFSDLDLATAVWKQCHVKEASAFWQSLPIEGFNDLVVEQTGVLAFTQTRAMGVQFHSFATKISPNPELVTCEIVETEVNGNPKRGIAIEGKLLGTVQQEAHSLVLGTTFEARVSADPTTLALVRIPNGEQFFVKGGKTDVIEELAQQPDIRLRLQQSTNAIDVFAARDRVGVVRRSDTDSYAVAAALARKATELNGVQIRPVPTTATLQIDSNTVCLPWQIVNRSLERESDEYEKKRQEGRATYERYKDRAYELRPQLAAGIELDGAVAFLARRDGLDRRAVASAIANSDTLLVTRPNQNDPAFHDYRERAVEYVKSVMERADALDRKSDQMRNERASNQRGIGR